MVLHIFNIEHDLSLAAHLDKFTPPEAARRLRADLGFLPALWASTDDAVLVTDVQYAKDELALVVEQYGRRMISSCKFVTYSDLPHLRITRIEPWGWDKALSYELARHGVDTCLLPDAASLDNIRNLSSRVTAAHILPELMGDGRRGATFICRSETEVREYIDSYSTVVLKSPWSSSGRGVRFLNDGYVPVHLSGWIKNTLKQQGCVMVEPYYKKVMDFGMEFYSDGNGNVRYSGLSVFNVSNGAYTGNLLTSESHKTDILNRYVPTDLLCEVKARICELTGHIYRNRYEGPFGVDMMVMSQDGDYLLHPCVEINLRRTMGHVALSLSSESNVKFKVMRILKMDNCYKFKIQTL